MNRRVFGAADGLALVEASARRGQPEPLFDAACEVAAARLGHRLFTVLAHRERSGEVERLYTSRPAEYPLRGRKPMGPTPWGERVLQRGEAWFGDGADAIRWAFPDHALILSLGCESCLNAPVRHDGRVLGVVSALDAAGRYDEGDLAFMRVLAGFSVPALLSGVDAG